VDPERCGFNRCQSVVSQVELYNTALKWVIEERREVSWADSEICWMVMAGKKNLANSKLIVYLRLNKESGEVRFFIGLIHRKNTI